MRQMVSVAVAAGVLMSSLIVDVAGAETVRAPACTILGKACPPLTTTQSGAGPVASDPAGPPQDAASQPNTAAPPPLPPCCKK